MARRIRRLRRWPVHATVGALAARNVSVPLLPAAIMAVGAALPLTREFFEDERVQVANGVGELAFRGVLLALLRQRMGTRAAVLVDSVLFGLWHIVPTLGAAETNDVGGMTTVATVAGAVVVTTVGGLVFCALRLRSGHLAAPVLVHLAFNVTGYALSWWVQT